MKLFYQEDRNEDFFAVCESLRKKSHIYSIKEIAIAAIRKEAQSFYLSPNEYGRIIREGCFRKATRCILKNELYHEIQERYRYLNKQYPHLNVPAIAKMIELQRAPRFYISEARAISLYYELLSKKYK